MDYVWIPFGLSMDSLMDSLQIPYGFPMDSLGIPCALCMDSIWILYGFSMDSLGILYGFSTLEAAGSSFR